MRKFLLFAALALPLTLLAQTTDVGKPIVDIQDDDITGSQGDVFWTKDNVYMLDGYVYVEEGTNLHIEPGTVIKAKETPTTGDIASVLIISRGAKIYAMGTASEPIIFTTEYDDVTLADNGVDDADLDFTTDRGLWGGLVVLGRTTLNVASEKVVEGLPDDVRAKYGGTDDADNSGVLRYISIRYTGIEVEATKELQGLTLGCVGSGTTVEYIESFNSDDDGFEFFGGTFNSRYLASVFASDDAFDYDQGFRGNHQFWFVLQHSDFGDHCGEYDSGDDGAFTATPLSAPVIFNATYIGRGASASGGDLVLKYKEYAGGEMSNSIFTDFDKAAIEIDSGDGETSYSRFLDGEIVFNNNIYYKESGQTDADLSARPGVVDYLKDAANNNSLVDPELSGISRTNDGGLDPRPVPGSPAWGAGKTAPNSHIKDVDYVGAFGADLWVAGWTALSANGLLPQTTTDVGKTVVDIQDVDITGSQGDVYWTNDNVYMLDGYVYVEEGTNLHIEPGTVIKAKEAPTTGDIASVLIISRGAKIYAMGTKEAPIIFTTEYDDVTLADNGVDDADLDFTTDRGLWGGLVVLGRTTLNVASEKVVEGLPDDVRAKYGGTDDADNSGVLRYISIRYTGIEVEATKELQGLTLGCVGSGTTVEYIESFNSDDDGFEFFGGTFNSRYLASVFASDDAFDYDQGFRGNHQFWFVLQHSDFGDHCGEYDSGDDGAFTATPLSAPVIFNATYIGRGASASGGDLVLKYKEYAGGEMSNSIFTDFDKAAIEIDSGDGETSYSRFLDGEIVFNNNIYYKESGQTDADLSARPGVVDYLKDAANNNSLVDPELSGISRTNDGGLDPRPVLGGAAYSTATKAAPNDHFMNVGYVGAFGRDLWIAEWTALAANGVIGYNLVGVDDESEYVATTPTEFALTQNFPNPFNPTTTIRFQLPEASNVRLVVYDMLGREIATLVDGYRVAGSHDVAFDASDLSSGVYVYRIEAGEYSQTMKMNLLK